MPPLPCFELIESFHQTNGRLRFWLDSITPAEAQTATEVRAATPQQMAGLLSELMRAGQRLRTLPAEKGAELELELTEYRKNVERLRDFLPAIYNALLRERARLEQERARVQSAAEWARRSRQTL